MQKRRDGSSSAEEAARLLTRMDDALKRLTHDSEHNAHWTEAGQRSSPTALLQSSAHQKAHLLKALDRRFSRIGDVAFIAGAGEVALRHASIIVARPDQAVEIDFVCCAHKGRIHCPAE